jgi:hypothetical protein
MKFIKLDLLTLLISLFLFASCENTSTIGLEIDPNSAVKGDLIDTLTISSRTIPENVPSTLSATRYPLGFLKDATFGTTEASLAMSVNLPSAAYDFGTSPVIDSAVLILSFGGEFYGDSTSTYSVDVHRLNLNLTKETAFPSTKEYPYYPALVGNKTGRLYPSTPYKVTDVVVGKQDTLRTVKPQLRIRLDKTFIQNTVVGAGTEALKSNANFNKYFGGLHVQINKGSSTGNGGLAFFDFSSARSELALYYHKTNATATTIDTVGVSFPIASSTGPVAATIKHDYTGTQVNVQLNDPDKQYPVTYLQPLGGLRNKISFPQMSKFAANIGKIIINKAELVIDLSAGSDGIPYGPAQRLSLYRYDIAERRQNLPDNDMPSEINLGDQRALGEAVFGGYFNPVTRQYVFVVTSYIQDLLDGKTKDYGTFLAPTPSTALELYPSIGTAARSVIGSFKKNSTAGDNMKLNIYYTKIN